MAVMVSLFPCLDWFCSISPIKLSFRILLVLVSCRKVYSLKKNIYNYLACCKLEVTCHSLWHKQQTDNIHFFSAALAYGQNGREGLGGRHMKACCSKTTPVICLGQPSLLVTL